MSFKIPTEKLLLVAGVVWFVGGRQHRQSGDPRVLQRAELASVGDSEIARVIFVLFHVFVFTKMVGKHSERIRGYEEDRTHILKFFDKKGYIIMAVMMGGGIGLRMAGLVPEWFVAFFTPAWGLRWPWRA